MKTMLKALQLRIDRANAHRSVEDAIKPLIHVEFASTDRDGDLHMAELEEIGKDYIQINGSLYDRAEIRSVQPINF